MTIFPDKPKSIDPQTLPCPGCAAELIGMTSVGDCSVCISCRALITLDVDHSLVGVDWHGQPITTTVPYMRYPTDEEERAWLTDPRVQAVIKAVAEHHARFGSPHPDINPGDTGKPPY